MNLVDSFLQWIDNNMVFCLAPMIVTLILIRWRYKDKLPVAKAFGVIKWIMIGYAFISLVNFVLWGAVDPDNVAMLQRATGPYAWAYWLMFAGTLSPFTLLIKKLGRSAFYMLIVAILMKLGMYMERFVIIITSLHRDYPPDGALAEPSLFLGLGLFLLQGIGLAILIVVILQLLERTKQKRWA